MCALLTGSLFPSISCSGLLVGNKHVAMGVTVDTFPIFGESLLEALQEKLGDKWNKEIEDSWLEVYKVFSSEMIRVMSAQKK